MNRWERVGSLLDENGGGILLAKMNTSSPNGQRWESVSSVKIGSKAQLLKPLEAAKVSFGINFGGQKTNSSIFVLRTYKHY